MILRYRSSLLVPSSTYFHEVIVHPKLSKWFTIILQKKTRTVFLLRVSFWCLTPHLRFIGSHQRSCDLMDHIKDPTVHTRLWNRQSHPLKLPQLSTAPLCRAPWNYWILDHTNRLRSMQMNVLYPICRCPVIAGQEMYFLPYLWLSFTTYSSCDGKRSMSEEARPAWLCLNSKECLIYFQFIRLTPKYLYTRPRVIATVVRDFFLATDFNRATCLALRWVPFATRIRPQQRVYPQLMVLDMVPLRNVTFQTWHSNGNDNYWKSTSPCSHETTILYVWLRRDWIDYSLCTITKRLNPDRWAAIYYYVICARYDIS